MTGAWRRGPKRKSIGVTLMAVALATSCGDMGNSPAPQPTAPTPPTTPTPPSNLPSWTYEGRIVSTQSHMPVAGAVVQSAAGGFAITDSAGAFVIPIASEGDPVVTIDAAGMLQRRTTLAGGQDRAGLTIDLIALAPPFSLDFYRQLARNRFDAPNGPSRRISRWEEQPNFYIKTTDQDGVAVEQARIDKVMANIRSIVPQATGGHFHAGAIETGPDDRPPQKGWIRVLFRSEPNLPWCGTAVVGANPGEVNLKMSCPGDPLEGPRDLRPGAYVVAHEVGHAMGLSHVAEGLMGRGGSGLQPGASPPQMRYDMTDLEKYHAAIIYSRPVGNADPDVDPSGFRFLRAPEGAPVVYCYFREPG